VTSRTAPTIQRIRGHLMALLLLATRNLEPPYNLRQPYGKLLGYDP
jgi:hypothetical protein